MSGVLRTGGGPARLLVAMLEGAEQGAAKMPLSNVFLRIPLHTVQIALPHSKAARRLRDLKYLERPLTDRIQARLTPEGLKAARIIRDGS